MFDLLEQGEITMVGSVCLDRSIEKKSFSFPTTTTLGLGNLATNNGRREYADMHVMATTSRATHFNTI